MNSIKKWLRDIFGFSGNEINGFLILIPTMIVIIFSEPLYSSLIARQEIEYEHDKVTLDSLLAAWNTRSADSIETHFYNDQVPFVAFDPNSAPLKTLLTLGFSETSANRIAAYRSKGGTFRTKSDLMKIYGMDSTLYKQLYRYILLPSSKTLNRTIEQPAPVSQVRSFKSKSEGDRFDINKADTVMLKTVYGIGSKLAARIIKFRNGLGGFIKPEQLKEVYGLDSMVVIRTLRISFIEEGFIPVKININKADEQQLSRHPYIRYKIARALLAYRFQHGDFRDVNDIKNVTMVNAEDIGKFLPYISISD